MEGSIRADIDNYDLTQSSSSDSEGETPSPKRKADDEAIATKYRLQTESETASINLQTTPKKVQSTKRPPPTEGYIYGFVLPFTVDNDEYCVVKIGKTAKNQLARRLRDHNCEFANATKVPIFHKSISASTASNQLIETFKENKLDRVFLVSCIQDGLDAAECGARACIGVAPFNTGPTFKTVFTDSARVTTTEWFIAKRLVKEHIQAQFWEGNLDVFKSADDFLEKLKELNKRRHVEVTISLETLTNVIYQNKVKVPQFLPDSRP